MIVLRNAVPLDILCKAVVESVVRLCANALYLGVEMSKIGKTRSRIGISVNALNSQLFLSELKKVVGDASHPLFANVVFLPTGKRLIINCQYIKSGFKN